MTEITLEIARAKLAELTSIIDKLTNPPAALVHVYPAIHIELRAGECYAGPVLNEDGSVKHHLVLMAERPSEKLNWRDALAWAALTGGSLPDRQEAALIFANCKPHVDAAWHWTSEEHAENASCAWKCFFGNGSQSYGGKVNDGTVRAVRRLNP